MQGSTELTFKGVRSDTIAKLKDGGFDSYKKIADADVDDLVNVGVGSATASKIIEKAKDELSMSTVFTADELYKEEQEEKRLTTGSRALDRLLGGGVRSKVLTEFYGKFGSSKTQMCLTMCVTAQDSIANGGLEGEVIYIDTENSFRGTRLTEIAEARGYSDLEGIRNKVHVVKALSSAHQLDIGARLDIIAKDKNIKLVIVDSLIALFRAEYIGRNTLSERQQLIAKHLYDLQMFAYKNDAVVVVTNQMQDTPDSFMPGDASKPTGGNVLSHSAKYIVYLKKNIGPKRIAKLMDSPDLETGECVIQVTKKGICDMED